MTGLDLRNVHLRSTDAGKTWKQVSADAFKSCMNGVSGEAETALADGTVIRGVFGFYLPYADFSGWAVELTFGEIIAGYVVEAPREFRAEPILRKLKDAGDEE